MIQFALALALSLSSQGDAAAELRTSLDNMAERHFRGLVYIERDGKEVFFHTVGKLDPATNKEFSRTTAVEIGSIVKPFVSVAVLRLAADGKLKLEDPISKFFPNTPEDKKDITVEMLMRHRAGFQDVFGGDYEPMERDQLMKLMLESKLIFKPGEKTEYSNAGYSMLSTIIEKVTGETIEQHLNRTQFKPLGMNKTGYVIPKWNKSELPVGVGPKGGVWGDPLSRFWYKDGPSWNLRGNGGMLSSALELARWSRGFHEGELLRPEDYAKIVPTFAVPSPDPERVWGALGGNGVFNTVMAYNKARKMTIIAFSTDGRMEIETQLRPMLPVIYRL